MTAFSGTYLGIDPHILSNHENSHQKNGDRLGCGVGAERDTLRWDAAKEQVIGDAEANQWLMRPYRGAWRLA